MLRPADVAFLHGSRPVRVDENRIVIDVQISELLPQASAVEVGADHAHQRDLCSQGAKHGSDAARSAEPLFPFIRVQQDDRRFLADPLGIAPHIAIEHHVAHDQDTWLPQPLYQFDQVG